MVSSSAVPAVTVELVTALNPVQRTVSASTQISGGSLMVMTEPNTVVKSGIADLAPAWGGVAAFEKSILKGDVSTSLL